MGKPFEGEERRRRGGGVEEERRRRREGEEEERKRIGEGEENEGGCGLSFDMPPIRGLIKIQSISCELFNNFLIAF